MRILCKIIARVWRKCFCPSGVAVDADGHIVVADKNNHRVQVVRRDGSVVRVIGSEGTGPGQFKHPAGVAVDLEGNLVVGEFGNCRVQVLRRDGTFVRSHETSCHGELWGVAVDAGGSIVAADCSNHRLEVFRAPR